MTETWWQIITLIGSNLVVMMTLFGVTTSIILAMRKESREDWKCAHAMIQAIQEEMKDFHGRLCAIEEKNKQGKK